MKPLIIKALLLASAVTAMGAAVNSASAAEKQRRDDRGSVERSTAPEDGVRKTGTGDNH